MKKIHFLISIGLLLVLFVSSCGGSATQPTASQPAAPQAAAPQSSSGSKEATVPPANPANPASPANSANPSSSVASPTSAPVQMGSDDFSAENTSWSDALVVTTQGQRNDLYSQVYIKNGKMFFDFRDKETYMYRFYTNPAPADVVVQAKMVSTGHSSNGMSLICRANSDKTAWYEVRLTSASEYWIFRYDGKLKSDKNLNPYVKIGSGIAPISKFHPYNVNDVSFTCQGKTLKLVTNDKEIVKVEDGVLTEGGQVGIAAMSHQNMPVVIQFDNFSFAQP